MTADLNDDALGRAIREFLTAEAALTEVRDRSVALAEGVAALDVARGDIQVSIVENAAAIADAVRSLNARADDLAAASEAERQLVSDLSALITSVRQVTEQVARLEPERIEATLVELQKESADAASELRETRRAVGSIDREVGRLGAGWDGLIRTTDATKADAEGARLTAGEIRTDLEQVGQKVNGIDERGADHSASLAALSEQVGAVDVRIASLTNRVTVVLVLLVVVLIAAAVGAIR